MSQFKEQDTFGKIAVVGMSARYPGSKNLERFWKNLAEGVESIDFFSDEELLASGVTQEEIDSPNYVKARGVYEGTFLFDAPFFGYTPREAAIIDPQQRVFLECCWEALEHAGYNPLTFPGRIGLFGGTGTSEYMIGLVNDEDAMLSAGQMAVLTSNEKDYLATRVGYKLNLRGPCVTVQSACSTSLVGVVLGCQNLLHHQSDMVLVGGVSISTQERSGYFYIEGGIMSPDGHCRSFDASSKGTIFSCGSGVVVLKRLEDALADRDTIHAVILGTGMNNDGAAKVGYTAPGTDGQVAVCLEALTNAGVHPETVTYIECHGTATALGDPIEVGALRKAFRAFTQEKQFCAIGSVKTNVGHTDAAAGVCGLTKTILSLEKKLIPPSLHFKKPNPEIDFDDSPFFVNTELREWKNGSGPRRAGISSFGVGGTNAHVIVEEAPEVPATVSSRPYQLLVWSARTKEALDALTLRLGDALRIDSEATLADIAHTLQVGRKFLAQRRALVCKTLPDARQALERADNPAFITDAAPAEPPKVAFLFPGQGSQYVNMGRELYEREPLFRSEVDRCCDLLRASLDLDLRSLLFPEADHAEQATEQLTQTRFTQPALFVIEYGLAKLLMTYGIQPDGMVGHSIGEYVAACLAGVFGLEDALALVSERGRLMQQMAPGSMLGVLLSEPETRALLETAAHLSIAAVNAPSTCVVSGPTPEVDRFEKMLEERGVPCRRLHTSHAFHSEMMEPILDPFRAAVRRVKLNEPSLPYLSNLTGSWITAQQATDPDYWVKHLRNAVRFSDGMSQLLAAPNRLLLEIGPGRVLSSLAAQHPAKTVEQAALSTLPHPKGDAMPAMEFFWSTLGRLWAKGCLLNWDAMRGEDLPRRVPLPTYPFEHQEYKINLSSAAPGSRPSKARAFLKKTDIADWFYFPGWKRSTLLHKTPDAPSGSWLLFQDECGLGAQIGQRLTSDGHDVVLVSPGDSYRRHDAQHYSIRIGVQEDYVSLLTELRAAEKEPRQIVHLWGVTPAEAEKDELEVFPEYLDRCFYSMIFLAQGLSSQYSTIPVRIHAVTNNVYDVTGESIPHPSKATVTGPCKTIPKEYLNIKSRAIDVQLPQDPGQRDSLVESLLAEFDSGAKDGVVAYRGGHRWIQTFEPTRVEVAENVYPKLREGGVYLITGGLGAVGLTLSEEMARAVKPKLLLLSRSKMPERDYWEGWLKAHAQSNRISRKIRSLLKIEELGAEVVLINADVLDLDQMREVVSSAQARFGAIHGVIHAAGTAGAGIIEVKTREIADRVLAPKIKGTLVLEQVFKHIDLDFFALCSSQTALIGYGGQVDYGSANAFMDAFAYSRKKPGDDSLISLNWDRWEEIGMAVDATEDPEHISSVKNPTEFRPVAHPVFGGHKPEDGKQVYIGVLSPSEHWLVGEHRLMGAPTLVGTAFLELARSAYASQSNAAAVELRDVTFISPLVLGEDERREIRVVLKDLGNLTEFKVQSLPPELAWQDHATGKIVPIASGEGRQHSLAAIAERCPENAEAAESGGTVPIIQERVELVEFGPRWDVISSVAIGRGEALATLQLAEQHASDLEHYLLHPALFDMATAFSIDLAANGGSYLPFSYKSVRIYKALPAKFYSHASFEKAKDAAQEIITLNLKLLDDQGKEIVVVEGYNMKKVHDSLIQAVSEGRMGSLPVPAESRPKAKKLEYILPKEGAEAFRRALSLTWLPMIVISPLEFQALEAEESARDDKTQADHSDGATGKSGHPRPNLSTPYEAPRNQLEQSIGDIWARVFGISEIGIHDSFLELGGHSLLAIQIASRMRETFEIELPVASFYNTPTVAGLAEAVLQALVKQADEETLTEALNEVEKDSGVAVGSV